MVNTNPTPDNPAMKDADIPTIFNPRRVRTPSVVVTEEDAPRNVPNGPFNNSSSLQHADSVTTNNSAQEVTQPASSSRGFAHKMRTCKNSCCSRSAKKIYYGVCVTVCVTATWVGATHCIKFLYLKKQFPTPMSSTGNATTHRVGMVNYNAPFFTTWFITNWTILFFPLYFLINLAKSKCKSSGKIITESFRNFREKGFTAARFMTRCTFFCLLWVATNYMYVHSLRILLATEVMALFATNVSCVYLLSWVILHEQFVGVRIVAVILCDTGIALLAYMDGITGSQTLGGVVLAACAGAGSAVYKVLFKKIIGEASYGQVSLFFSLIGLFNASLLWPLCLTLYFTGLEILHWNTIPWAALLGASGLSLAANLLGNFSCAITYDLFITLGLITAVPVSAALDVILYGAEFAGMKLAGIILISVGFFLVMFPDNWPDYITRLLRSVILLSHSASDGFAKYSQVGLASDSSLGAGSGSCECTGFLDGNGQMEVSLSSGGTKHSLETVRVLHETVIALRTALECSRKELSELRRRSRNVTEDVVIHPASMDNDHESESKREDDGKPDSGAESEDIDDIELVFTTGETDPGAMHEDMVPIYDERKPRTQTVLVETDISKCGVIEENDETSSRRTAIPDPLPYRPIIHREVLASARASKGSPLKSRPVPGCARQETGAQTDITAVPAIWRSETYLAHKVSYNLTTLPSKFTLPVPRTSHLPLSEKSREARRVLLSDINFTSMVPELSRSADHLHQDEYLHRHHPGECMTSYESGWESRTPEVEKHGSRSSWESRFQASQTSIPRNEAHAARSCRVLFPCRHSCHSWSSVPSFKCHSVHHIVRSGDPCARRVRNKGVEHRCCPPGLSLPDLRTDSDSGESTDSLIDEAEEFLRRSIDNMILQKTNMKRNDRRHSETDFGTDLPLPNSAQPFLPKSPSELKHNYLVKVITGDGRIVMGRVRFSGEVTGNQEPFVGVELQSSSGSSDGTFLGHRYFDCKPDHAVFVPFKKVVLAWCT